MRERERGGEREERGERERRERERECVAESIFKPSRPLARPPQQQGQQQQQRHSNDAAATTAASTRNPRLWKPSNNHCEGSIPPTRRCSARSTTLVSRGPLSARSRARPSPRTRAKSASRVTSAVETLLECIGEDPDREGLQKTPLRYAKALLSHKGDVINGRRVRGRPRRDGDCQGHRRFSLCEHHMVPFVGKVAIGYIPNRRVNAEMYSRRLQVQERLTKQIAVALWEVLQPQGVAVTMEASHMCMVMRGVEKPGSSTVTSCMLGVFRDDPKTREEFLKLSQALPD
ncbi:GTP cyclohydrolase 1 [Zopfochytrium polystomum]|nr:GTP cyclohydrolase 1 [Zopfochytrium polystomum]